MKKKQDGAHLSESEFRKLHGIYTSLSNPAAYGSARNLTKQSGLSLPKVKQYLSSSKTWTKFKQTTNKYKRLPVRSLGLNHIWSMDVAYMEKIAKENDGVQYLLVAVDVLSRFLRVQPMKSKTAAAAKLAFQRMVKDHFDPTQMPIKLWTDQGKEFRGVFGQYCSEMGIDIYHTYSDAKSSMAERYIRTLKNILYKYFEERNTVRYVNNLQKFVKIINSRENSSIGMPPANVTQKHVKELVEIADPRAFNEWTPRTKKKQRRSKFVVGDTVRIAKKNLPFKKGYKQKFTDEVFTIKKVSMSRISKTEPVTYVLSDNRGEEILGRFYEQELVPYKYVEDRHRAKHQTSIGTASFTE